jgi:Subtilase family
MVFQACLLFWTAIFIPVNSEAQQMEVPEFYGVDAGTNLVNLADVLGAKTFYSNGITGQNTKAWVVDAQLVGTNLYQAERMTNVTATNSPPGVLRTPGEHATFCAALLMGNTGSGYYLNTGLAYGTTIGTAALATSMNAYGSFSLNTDGSSATNSLQAYIYAASHGNVLSTSIGDSSDTAGVGLLSGLLDSLAASNPNTTMVAAAGNGGPSPGTVGGPASGYNTISVGALDGPTNYNVTASFSSRGPQPTAWYDGTNTFSYGGGISTRPGVDLTAPGTSLFIPTNMTVTATNLSASGYLVAGTSFATPLVAAGAVLLDSTAITAFSAVITNAATRSDVVKAVLMNSADKLPGWNNGQQIAAGVITTTQALDWSMGAGRMNLNEAFSQYTTSDCITTGSSVTLTGFNEPVQSTGWGYGTAVLRGKNDYTLVNRLFQGQQFAVTLDWMRSQIWQSAISDYVDLAQAELDLMVYRVASGGDQLVAQSISPVSTTQELWFPVPDTGTYMIEVDYSTNLFDFSGSYASQDYGIAWSVSGVPEPGSVALVLLGGVILLAGLRSNFTAGAPLPNTLATGDEYRPRQ